jgi:dihydroorotate dehydrogenase (NAD+) catalytic subunit
MSTDTAVAVEDVDLTTTLGPLVLSSPVAAASGAAGWGREPGRALDLAQLGLVITPSVQMRPAAGWDGLRIAETPSGMVAALGRPNPGIAAFLERELPLLAEAGARVGVSIAGESTDDLVALVRALYGSPAVALIEVNLAAPDTGGGRGQPLAADPVAASRLISGARRSAHPSTPVFAKLGIDGGDVVALARACVDAGADGLSLISPPAALVLDERTLRPLLGGVTGGLSGPAIRPIALRCVYQVRQALPATPLIGSGGIASGIDALQFLAAGASAVAVGTALLADPSAPVRIRDELRVELADRGLSAVEQAVGLAHRSAGGATVRHVTRPDGRSGPILGVVT